MQIDKKQFFSYMINKVSLEILDSGVVEGDSDWKGKNICSPFSRLYYIEEGTPILRFNSKTVLMKPGRVYIIPAGQLFSHSCEGSFRKIFFHFNIIGPNGYDLFAELRDCPSLPLPDGYIEKMIEYYTEDNLISSLRIKEEILKTVISLLPDTNLSSVNDIMYSPAVQKTIDYIRLNLSVQLTAKELAGRLYICESTLSKKFRREVGVTIGTYIDDLIFFNAEKMLLKTKWSINQISETLGFCDQFYFSRRFKQKYGQTPVEYRKKLSTAL